MEEPEAYYHTMPLHYAPYLMATGRLFSQARIRELGLPLSPRRTVARRDRKLRLHTFVHLSLKPVTPLLVNKLQLGYPHILLVFETDISMLSGTAYLKYNAKAWRHRQDFEPVAGMAEKAKFLDEWGGGRYPSAELLIPDTLPIEPFLREWATANVQQAEWLMAIRDGLHFSTSAPIVTRAEWFPGSSEGNWETFEQYRMLCLQTGEVLPPPVLPFD